MRSFKLENILDACIAEIRSGQATVEECLQRYADHAPALEPLLCEVACLTTLRPVTMPTDAVDALERRVLSRAAGIRAGLSQKERPVRRSFWSRLAGRRVRLLPVALSLVIALAVAGAWTISASASSLPGEALYPVKLATERARLAVTFRHEARARLHLAFAERRLGEMQILMAAERSVEEGLLETLVAETSLALEEIEEVAANRKAGIAVKLLALTERQQAVLTSVRARAPEEAQKGLNQALEASRYGHERALIALGMTPEPPQMSSVTPSAGFIYTPHATPTGTPEPTETPTSTPTPEERDRSSLYFDGDYGCQGDCEEIRAKVCNGQDSGDMAGPTTWELYWIASRNPKKKGTLITSGTIDPLEAGRCQILTYDPGDNPNGASGNYMFKAYERPGHQGKGKLCSDTCKMTCEVTPTETPEPPEAPEPTGTPEPTETPTSTPTPEERDRSSLYFDGDYGCQGGCEEIRAKVCNGQDSGDMAGPTTWELYWIASRNPKKGTLIASGTIDPLEAGQCQILTYDPGDNPNDASGNYMFKAYERPGHQGKGKLCSDTCKMTCEVTPTETPEPAEMPKPTKTPKSKG